MMITIKSLKSVDSTNSEAMRIVQKTGEMNFALSAEEQTAGKGRYNRKWEMVEGNIAVTIVVPRPQNSATLSSIALMTGIAIHDALSLFVSGAPIRIKWPNDILINGAKVSGTLVEADSKALYIGIGINMVSSSLGLEHDTANLEPFTRQTAKEVMECLVNRWSYYFDLWSTYGFVSLIPSYTSRMSKLNEPIEISFDAEKKIKKEGICRGIDDSGRILLEDINGQIEAHHYGDLAERTSS